MNSNSQRIILLVSVLPVLLSFALFVAFKSYVHEKYAALISNTAILHAVRAGDSKELIAVLKEQGLDFQQVREGRLVGASNMDLPRPHILNYSAQKLNKVIDEEPAELLPQTLPYLHWSNGDMYLISVLSTRLDSKDVYLVYSKLF